MQQISINLPDDLLAFVQRTAGRETRPVALQIRHFIAEAMRAELSPSPAVPAQKTARPEPGSSASSHPPIPTDLAEQKAELAQLELERGRLVDLQRKRAASGGLDPTDERRLSFIGPRMDLLRSHIRVIERAQGVKRD